MMKLDPQIESFARTELEKLVRIPSISFDGFDPKYVHQSGEATAELFEKVGLKNIEIKSIDKSLPYVLGETEQDPSKPTLLLYAHHDVQPPGREELWKSSPFEPNERDGRLYGRGTADDKGGILVHIAAIEAFRRQSKELPVNLKLIVEGEEETGSFHLLKFLKENQERLKADAIIVTDTANIQSGVPTLTTSLRGLIVVEIVVKSLRAPLHSGMWGGAVADPASILVNMIASLVDNDGNIQLPSIAKPKAEDYSHLPLSRGEFSEQAGVLKENSVPQDFLDRVWNRASFAVNAIQASSEKLANNIICDRAFARIGIRISKNESAVKIQNELLEKLRREVPDTVELELRAQEPNEAWSMDPLFPGHRWAFKAAEKALPEAYGKPLVYAGCGASIPFIGPFEKALGAPVLTLGIEDPYTLAHSENESLLLSDLYKAILGETLLFQHLAQEKLRKDG